MGVPLSGPDASDVPQASPAVVAMARAEGGSVMPDRAVVAISEDRQWLVVLDRETLEHPWSIYQREVPYARASPFELWKVVEDTGQSADEVLREFLASPGGTQS